jgi:hypothetical protein
MNGRLATFLTLAIAAVFAAPAAAEDQHSDNVSHVANISYEARWGDTPNYGTDVEFAQLHGRRHAIAGSEINGLQIIDVNNPRKARRVRVYDCAISQGDPQVFRQGGRTFTTYANDYEDTAAAAQSRCYQDLTRKGIPATTGTGEDEVAKLGTLIIEITRPNKPRAVGFVEVPRGSHNTTMHPSGKYLYNSNSDLMGIGGMPSIEVYDLRDVTKPKQVATLDLTPLPGLGADSHDITFNKAGTRAYSAALSHGVIIDTENPAAPEIVSEFDDESINVWHQSDPFTIRNDKGEVERELLIVEDEVAGAAGPGVCPTGGVHVFDVTDEALPVKVGYWNITDFATRDPLDTCTAHVFDIHEEEQIMTIAYYMGGVRVVDLSGLADLPIGVGQGDQALGGAMKQIGYYMAEDANAWSVKTPDIEPDGDFYMYANDINRGFDVYRFEADKEPAEETGKFLAPAAAKVQLDLLGTKSDKASERRMRGVFCLLPRDRD